MSEGPEAVVTAPGVADSVVPPGLVIPDSAGVPGALLLDSALAPGAVPADPAGSLAPSAADTADTADTAAAPALPGIAPTAEPPTPEQTPAAGDSASDAPPMEDLLAVEALPVTDSYGFLAAWRAAMADTAVVRPLVFAPRKQFASEPLLERIRRRFSARWFVREQIGYKPEFFLASDSLAVRVDAIVDSLIETQTVAPSVFYRATRTGGQRFLLPDLPRGQSRRGAARKDFTVSHSVDLDRATLTRQLLHDGAPVVRSVAEPFAAWMLHLTRVTQRDVWKQAIDESQKQATVQGGRAGLVRITVPFEMPQAVKSIFGEGKPNLAVSGSENISFGGKSQWYPHRPSYEFGRKQSKFPQLQMEQDLSIKLKGSVGDKLDIDVDQSSQAQSSFANRIQIHYKGYEDEIIRRVDLGNTSLSLPGTEYVSYGGKHTGLFGINSEAQLGPMTLNMIVSKQEGQTVEASTSIRSERKEKIIYDYQYVRDRFFFLDDPTRDAYPGHAAFVLHPEASTIQLWLDDGNGYQVTEASTQPGVAVLDLDGPQPAGPEQLTTGLLYFEELQHGIDYWVYTGDERYVAGGTEVHPYIVLNRYLSEKYTLGITYRDAITGEAVGGRSAGDTLYVKMLRPDYDLLSDNLRTDILDVGGVPVEGWGKTHRLMLKNVYSFEPTAENWSGDGLPELTVLDEDLEITVHYDGLLEGAEDPDQIGGTKLIRHLGLDYYKLVSDGFAEGQDNIVDITPWVDLNMGLIFFPDLQPFAPTDSILEPGAERTYELRGRPGDPSQWDLLPEEFWNRSIYEQLSCFRGPAMSLKGPAPTGKWDSKFYLQVKYKTPVSGIQINDYDIIEGSEVVTAGGRRLTKGSDYQIDYQTGEIQVLDNAAISEDQEINVTYKRASSFGTASKTLVGAAVFYAPEDSPFRLSTSWLYEQKGSPDRRPRLGSEPTRTAVGELAAGYRTESMGITRLLDRLPLLDVRRPSTFDFEGGLGVSFPNPNTRNDLYLDDFEGVDEDISVRINRMAWGPSSIPHSVAGFDLESRAARRGELWWYTPYHTVQEGDLNPTLDLQEANDYTQVLEVQFFPYPSSAVPETLVTEYWPEEESWGGIIQGLSATKLDLSKARFLDIWINDYVPWDEFETDSTLREGVLHVDIGQMSEDALWQRRAVDCDQDPARVMGAPLVPPNGVLDSEDRDGDGELDFSDTADEDTGLDGIAQGSGNGGNDYFYYDSDKYGETTVGDDQVCDAYSQINGTEHNGRLDSEDLDGDNSLDVRESYFEYSIALSDTDYVDVDVSRDYRGKDLNWPEALDKGWRRVRIPLSDAHVDSFVNSPSWTEIKHLRLWFSGFSQPRRLQIGSIELRANRWLVASIQDSTGRPVPTTELELVEEEFFPGVVNNKEDSGIYTPPFEEHRDQQRDNIREREQSLTLEMRNLQPGHTGRVYSELRSGQGSTGQNLLDYASLEFFLSGTVPVEEAAGAEFFLRLCKEARQDTTHFYEYSVPLPSVTEGRSAASWRLVKIELADLSDLKLLEPEDPSGTRHGPVREDGSYYSMRGTPYLTSVGRITLGVRTAGSGQVIRESAVWIDELRLTDVNRDAGYAYRLKLNSQLSDFARIDLAYKRIGADFSSLSGGRGEKVNESAFTAGTSLPIERLLPRAAQLRMPFSYTYSFNERVPKYRTRDDILVGDDPTDRDITRNVQRGMTLGISRERSRSRWLQTTIDAFKINTSYKESFGQQPTARDSTRTASLQVGYGIDFGTLGDIQLHRKLTVNPLPTNLSVNLGRSQTEEVHYEREGGILSNPFFKNESRSRTTRSGSLTLGTGLRPIKPVNYTFSQSRNLMRRQEAGFLGGLNIGKETARDENLSVNQQVRLLRGWIEPRLAWKGSFKGQFDQQQGGGASLERSANLSNDQTATVSGDLPIARLFDLLGNLTRGGGKEAGEAPAEPPPDDKEALPGEDPERAAPQHRPGRPQGAAGRRGEGQGELFGGALSVARTSASYSNGKRSTYRKTVGEPDLAYQLGLSRDPGARLLDQAQVNLQDQFNYSLDVDLRLLRRINATTKLSRNESEQRSLGKTTGTVKTTWPDLDLRWGELSQWLHYRDWFRSIKANTHYTRDAGQTLQEGSLSRRDVTARWAPFVDLSVGLRNGMTVTMRVDRSSGTEEDYDPLRRALNQVNENAESKVTLGTKRTFNVTRMITMPITGRQERITTRLDLGLQVRYEARRRTQTRVGAQPVVTVDRRLFDFGLNGSYQFTKTVTGRVVLNFGEDADNENRTNTRRYVEVKLTAGFTF